jgi:adenine-specific DNA-methyltransferase
VPSKNQPKKQLDLLSEHNEQACSTSDIFRPIHYLGSKLRLAPQIAHALDCADTRRGTVLDLFAGSGTTALAMTAHRRVITSDIQEYSRVLCNALLSARPATDNLVSEFESAIQEGSASVLALKHALEPLVQFEHMALVEAAKGAPEAICSVLEHGSILAVERGVPSSAPPELFKVLKEVTDRLSRVGFLGSAEALTVRYFGGAYFSYAQALELDCLALIAKEKFSSEFSDLLTAALLSTASDTVNTVGKQFAQPLRPRNKQGVIKSHLLTKIIKDRQLSVSSTYLKWLENYVAFKVKKNNHIAVCKDYRDALNIYSGEYSVVYADPPYTRDHYSRFYHVLETIARRDNPEIALSPGSHDGELSRGLYRNDRHQSPFCIRSQVSGAFEDLFKLASKGGANMVLSYSPFESGAHPRVIKIDDLISLASKFYNSVELEVMSGVSHSKLNHSQLNFEIPSEAEVLLVCRLKP